MTTTVSPATSFSLNETDGVQLTLTDRALPYLPLTISGRQRAEFTWYPGSPQATVQMLGPEEGVISFRGYWKDKFLAGAVKATGGGASTPDTVSGLVNLVDRMRRSGRLITLAWDSIIRYGHITSFTQTWYNAHDCEWEIEFSVVSQVNPETPVSSAVAAPTVTAVAAATSQLAVQVEAATQAVLRVEKIPLPQIQISTISPAATSILSVSPATAPAVPSAAEKSWWDTLNAEAQKGRAWGQGVADAANTFAFNVNTVAQQAVGLIQTPAQIAQSLLSVLNVGSQLLLTVTNGTTQIAQSYGAVVDGALTEIFLVAEPLGLVQQDQVPFGIQIADRSYVRTVQRAVRDIRYSNAILRSQYTQEQQATTVRVYVTPANMDLRDVSRIYYKTPDNWIQLMWYNGLVVSRVPAGHRLLIPERPDLVPVGRPS